ncbi:MAG: excinuclease ABC subunit UvrC [Spirochaetia bacterium]|nr:excinuclease ABC subunit UvrC [Spirochaetia bacterium]
MTPKEAVRSFPHRPGVYLMKNEEGTIIYVGKAKDLKKRVSSYFLSGRDIKTSALVKNIASIDFIVTISEGDALLLENNLIKKHMPKYNISLKDGKSYPLIRVTNEPFPKIFKTRNRVSDGSLYFGPYPSAGLVDVYLDMVKEIFPLRRCTGKLKKRDYPCLYFHIGLCKAPCVGRISQEEYAALVNRIKEILVGDADSISGFLKTKMEEASQKWDFETAARYRNFLASIAAVTENREVMDYDPTARDYFAYASESGRTVFCVLQIRDGKLSGKDLFRFRNVVNEEEALGQFFLQYYGETRLPPAEIYAEGTFGAETVAKAVSEKCGCKTRLAHPTTDRDLRLTKMAKQNCIVDLDRQRNAEAPEEGLKALKEIFALPKEPQRIEGFDIAHLHGKYTTASLVSFWNGRPDKKNYRHFNIKTLHGKIDDFESMREATARRYMNLVNDSLPLPDLILIDGGLGQINAVFEILESLGIEKKVTLLSLAKRDEEIYRPRCSQPVCLPKGDPALRVLQNVRDEAHRFATSFNQELRRKGTGL